MTPDHLLAPEPLRQYALIADGERGAVIGPRGDIAFLCAPRWHDPAVFSTLIGGAGHYVVSPVGTRYVWGGHYEEGSLVWRSRWVTDDGGIVECREALAFPGDRDRLVLLRQVRVERGDARLLVDLDPRAGFGAHPMDARRDGSGTWQGTCGPLHLRWRGAPEGCAPDGTSLRGEIRLAEGQRHDLVLELSERPLPATPPDPDRAWGRTELAWRDAAGPAVDSLAPGDVRHSLAVLRGLTSADGGMVAAATMCLPERADRGRNYDYRYAWIRDQAYAGQAAAVAGADDLLDSATGFVAGRLLDDGPRLKPAYTVAGGPVPDERDLDLAGYPGGADKVGNWVNGQFQLDALGEALLLLAAAAGRDRLDGDQWKAARVAAEAIGTRWQDPDAGIWELEDRRWAHSRLICAAGLRAMAAARPGRETDGWDAFADRLVADTERDCAHPSGRWQRAADDERVDAALLTPGLRGALPAEHPRSVATWRAVREDLARDGYVYRFRHDDRPLHEAEGAFLLCGFDLAMVSHRLGDPVDAARWFERSRGALGPPGLFTEEFDVVQRQLRGNLPQAFVHARLVEAAVRLADPPHRQS
jgi:hypothetical protein